MVPVHDEPYRSRERKDPKPESNTEDEFHYGSLSEDSIIEVFDPNPPWGFKSKSVMINKVTPKSKSKSKSESRGFLQRTTRISTSSSEDMYEHMREALDDIGTGSAVDFEDLLEYGHDKVDIADDLLSLWTTVPISKTIGPSDKDYRLLGKTG